jgi:hypothetical protein
VLPVLPAVIVSVQVFVAFSSISITYILVASASIRQGSR